MINNQSIVNTMNEPYETDSECLQQKEQIEELLILCLKKLKRSLRDELLTDEEENKIKQTIQEIESGLGG